MLVKTGVHHYSSNNIVLGMVCGKYYRVCTLAIIDRDDSFFKIYIYWLCYYSCPIYPPHSTPSCPPLPSHITHLWFMPMGHTYKFFGSYISYTILTLPLSIFYLPFMLLIEKIVWEKRFVALQKACIWWSKFRSVRMPSMMFNGDTLLPLWSQWRRRVLEHQGTCGY